MVPRPDLLELTVPLGARSYPILIGRGLLAAPPADARALLRDRNVLVLTDDHVAPLYLEAFASGFGAEARRIVPHRIAPGEAGKTVATWSGVLDALVAAGAQRDAVLVALGGGVVGDIGGFAAASYMRGIDFVQCPTTLLAQVDASVGGKTGVNHARGKNLIGAFHQPRAVLVDVTTLATLAAREYAAGLAETAKVAVLGAPGFFPWLEAQADALARRDAAALVPAIHRACSAKADIVRQDEREAGVRALLNLGHTFGHAIETVTGYERFLHGEAVAIGMVLAFRLSVRLGLCPTDDLDRVVDHLTAVGLPTRPQATDASGMLLDVDAVMATMARDKKVADGRLTFILARGIGKSFIARDVDPAKVRAMLADTLV